MATVLRAPALRVFLKRASNLTCSRSLRAAVCQATDSSSDATARPSGGGSARVDPPDVRKLARMAQIEVTDEEVADWGPKIEGILEWFGQLQEADLEGVPPALRADVEDGSWLREDTAKTFPYRQEMLEQVPLRQGAFVKVPKTTTGSS